MSVKYSSRGVLHCHCTIYANLPVELWYSLLLSRCDNAIVCEFTSSTHTLVRADKLKDQSFLVMKGLMLITHSRQC